MKKPRHHVIGIVAHTRRTIYAQALSDQVDAVHIGWDDGHLGAGVNHHQVWQHLNAHHADWCVALEDDAIPINDFAEQLGAALTHAPAPIVSLYLGKDRPPQWQPRLQDAVQKAEANQAAWLLSDHLLHAVGLAVRHDLLPDMIDNTHRRWMPIDECIGLWARRNRHPIAYTWPSLVDHNDQLPTLVRHRDGIQRTPGRIAWKTGTREDWETATVTI